MRLGNRSLIFTVPCPNAAKFLKVEPKSAVPVGMVMTAPGVVQGISATGEILIEDMQGRVTTHRSGSLTFATPLSCS